MSTISRWWAHGAAAMSGVILAVSVPALAWAAQAPGTVTVALEVARRRPRSRGVGGFGLIGGLCCLVVVGLIVVAVVLIARRRRR